MAGTQFLDHEWRLLKRLLPETGIRARTVEDRARAELYIRAAQWRRMVGNEDFWPAFCAAAQDWMCEELTQQLKTHRHLHPLAWHRRESKTRVPQRQGPLDLAASSCVPADDLTQEAAPVECGQEM